MVFASGWLVDDIACAAVLISYGACTEQTVDSISDGKMHLLISFERKAMVRRPRNVVQRTSMRLSCEAEDYTTQCVFSTMSEYGLWLSSQVSVMPISVVVETQSGSSSSQSTILYIGEMRQVFPQPMLHIPNKHIYASPEYKLSPGKSKPIIGKT